MEKLKYRRRLPHIHPPGETLFVTFRLAGTLPRELVHRWVEEQQLAEGKIRNELPPELVLPALHDQKKRLFAKFDAALDKALYGPDWLKQPDVAHEIISALRYFHGTHYELFAFCVMPNHVHVVLKVISDKFPFYKVMQSVKSYSAKRINSILGRTGQVWHREHFDYVVRNGVQLKRIVFYTLENPVKAGLCKNWDDWPFSYWRED